MNQFYSGSPYRLDALNEAPTVDLFPLNRARTDQHTSGRPLMALPLFALSRSPPMIPLTYVDGAVSFEVRPSADGIATIYDKEILLQITRLLSEKIELGGEIKQDLEFAPNDLSSGGGHDREASASQLSEALKRLRGTQIKTHVEVGSGGEESFFSWLSEARLRYIEIEAGKRRLQTVRVRLCDWLFHSVRLDRNALSYAPSYFQLGVLERRIYEVARSARDADPLVVDLTQFQKLIGDRGPLVDFRSSLERIAKTDAIPSYHLHLIYQPCHGRIGMPHELRDGVLQVRILKRRQLS